MINMKMFNIKNIFHIVRNIAKLKNYVFTNIMAIYGYSYAVKLHQLNQKRDIIYLDPGADTTDEGIMHTFDSTTALANFIIISFMLAILSIAEYLLRKKFAPNGVLKVKLPLFIEILHSIVFWIGMWFPLSRLAFAILLLLLAPIIMLAHL